MECPHCGERLDLITMDRLILDKMHRRKAEMEKNKEHLTDYSGYAILLELIKIFTTLEKDYENESRGEND